MKSESENSSESHVCYK